jgi:hypothetical protein
MTKKFEARSIIICDDVRAEAGGKQMIFGLYDEEILVQSFPVVLPKLCFRISTRVYGSDPKTISFKIHGKDGQEIVNFSGPHAPDPQQSIIGGYRRYGSLFAVQPCVFTAPGTFTISMGMDGPPRKVGEFYVVLPRNAEERSRLTKMA